MFGVALAQPAEQGRGSTRSIPTEVLRQAADKAARVDPENDQAFALSLPAAVISAARDQKEIAWILEQPEVVASSGFSAMVLQDPTLAENARALITAAIMTKDRIVGPDARVDEIDEHPGCVAVGSDHNWCCTGVLIAPDRVLTAAHCVAGGCAARVYLGTDVRDAADSPERVLNVKAVIHPEYLVGERYNDVAVLILDRPVDIAPVPIATAEEIAAASSVRLAGFGRTDFDGLQGYGVRRKVDVPIASAACLNGAVAVYGCDPGHELVAAPPIFGNDSCNGDSGGPAFIRVSGGWKLAGVTSRAIACSRRACGEGGIYVRADRYAQWALTVNAPR